MSHLQGLQAALGSATLITDPDITASYSHDQAPFAEHQPPFAVLLAKSAEEISIALRYANEHQIPVVTRGAGSGLAGGANASTQSLVISLEKMNQIIAIDQVNRIARVQAMNAQRNVPDWASWRNCLVSLDAAGSTGFPCKRIDGSEDRWRARQATTGSVDTHS